VSTGDVFYPKVGINPDGNALAAWFELDLALPPASAYSVWSNRSTDGLGWRMPEQVGSGGGPIGTSMPSLAIGIRTVRPSRSGRAAAKSG
jgi:hypothetical protein